jgi:phage head maturation protease
MTLGQLRGTVNALADMEEGLGFTATFAKTRASADAVELIRSGAYDAVSVGAEVQESHYDKDLKATVVTKASLVELTFASSSVFGRRNTRPSCPSRRTRRRNPNRNNPNTIRGG